MSNFLYNISGCLKLEDYIEAAKWLKKAQNSLIFCNYSALVLELEKSWPNLFIRNDFHNFKDNITSLDSEKTEIISALKTGDYEYAKKSYSKHFSYKTFPEFGDLLNKHTKSNSIKAFKSSIKENLSTSEQELLLDMDTHLEHPDKPFYRRIRSELADFYITKTSHYLLSIYEHENRTVRHLPWSHPYARGVLSAELGEPISINNESVDADSVNLGEVSLIGDFTPKDNDLTDARYFTLTGRDYFSSALETLTDKNPSLTQKIDIDNFMKMKEVIPTASQMKAIHSQGNYIIDGPAGTGKSTTLLQKLLILTQQSNIQGKDILVLVKHDGLIEPFKQLLLDMKITGVHIDSITNFLSSQFGKNHEEIHLSDIDRTERDAIELNDALNIILNEISFNESIIDYLPSQLINKQMIAPELKKLYLLKHDIELLKLKITNIEFALRSPIINEMETRASLKILEESSLSKRLKHKQGLKLDNNDRQTLNKLEKKYTDIDRIRLDSPQNESGPFESIIDSIEKELLLLEKTMAGLNTANRTVNLGLHIESKIQYEVNKIKDKSKIDIPLMVSKAFNENKELKDLKTKNSKKIKSIKIIKDKISNLIWDKALITNYQFEKQLIHLFANKIERNKTFQTIIIDEAQDAPNNSIELVNLYSKQLILAGDEAQNENENGLGFWGNLRDKVGFQIDSKLTIFKLRHNFRQTYELGNLSYNYRQLLLGQSTEDLEVDYFENQKGFNKPSIENINELNSVIQKKLKYISDHFTQNFPLVIIASDAIEQKTITSELITKNITASTVQDSKNVDVLVLIADEVAGREFPVVISMINNNMADSTVYIILSRAKFDLTLVVPSKDHINAHLNTLNYLKMISLY